MHGAVFIVPPPHQPCPRRHLPTYLQPAVANPYLPKKEVVNPYAASMAAAKKKAPGGAVVNPYGAAAAAAAGKAKPAGKSPVGGWPGGAVVWREAVVREKGPPALQLVRLFCGSVGSQRRCKA